MGDDPQPEKRHTFLRGCIVWGGGLFGGLLLGATALTTLWYHWHVWMYGSSAEWWGSLFGPPLGAVVGGIWIGLLRWFLGRYLPRLEKRDQQLQERFPNRPVPDATTRWLRYWGGATLALLTLLILCSLPLFVFGLRVPPPPRKFGFGSLSHSHQGPVNTYPDQANRAEGNLARWRQPEARADRTGHPLAGRVLRTSNVSRFARGSAARTGKDQV